MNRRDARFRILRLLDNSIEVFAHSNLRDDRVEEAIEQVSTFKDRFITFAGLATCNEMKAKLQLPTSVILFNSYGDTVATASKIPAEPLDRDELMQSTLQVMECVQKSDLPDYARDVLLLKMKALLEIMSPILQIRYRRRN